MKTRVPAVSLLGLALAASLFVACDSSSTAPVDAPDGHTVVRGGVAHAPGLQNPTQECVGCHGADLRGGDSGEPSCFSCHGQTW